MGLPKLEIVGVSQVYNEKKVLEVESLKVFSGDSLVVFGPNGAGKSTLLRIMALVEKPFKGDVFFEGRKVDDRNSLEFRRKLALLLSRPFFFKGSVRENLLYGLKIRKASPALIKERLEKVVELFSLSSLLAQEAQSLSGGEAQRVHLARAFILEPEILFLDEPFSALDYPTREGKIRELKRIIEETGQTTVLVTHYREEAIFLAKKVAVLIGGRIAQEGQVEEVFNYPVNSEVARLVGAETVLKGVVKEKKDGLLTVRVGEREILASGQATKEGEETLLFIKPEDVLIAREKLPSSIRNWFSAKILKFHSFGRLLQLELDCGFLLKASLTQAAWEELGLTEGEKVWAGVKATAVRASSPLDSELKEVG
jgi:tungstate transport system ATP-binding protein